ncbi:MAG: oxidoreductase [Pseudopedobacter saltans]|uniref:Oxidoreductase n=1 Tax=Pseudopedobacter saltans TaxID=151895 RepID=A0A2W5HDU5_9SPHI|nr:MAG: oxidoreductase [Pseudopedobacter saltans]
MQEIKVRISKIVDETPDTRSFYLEQLDGKSLDYVAGQFLTFIFSVNGREVRRSYSIGSTPGYENELFITVKRKENGEISRKMLDHFKEGDILTCLLPSGKFINESDWGNNLQYFFFAAGSGIVPVYGIIKSILHKNPNAPIFLLNQTTSEQDIIYKDGLSRLQNKYVNFEYQLFLSRPSTKSISVQRLNNLQVEKLVNDRVHNKEERENARFYVCGPTTFMRMVRFTLRLDGFREEQIKQEQFVIQENNYSAPLIVDKNNKHVKILAKEGIFEFEVQYPETILHAGKIAKVSLPFSCSAGQCSTCAVVCTSGEVVMTKNDILTDKDLTNGLVLTCTGHPATDIVLDYTLKN